MSFKVETLDHNMAKITLEAEAERLEKAIDKAYQKQRGQISIPGFRKGKVPRKMIEKMYGPEVFYDEAANILMPEVYSEMLEENKEVEIVSQPQIDIVQIESGKPFIFTAEVALRPDVKLGEYKGLEVSKKDTELTDEEFEEALTSQQKQNMRTIEVTDRAVRDGDTIKLAFDGYVDGKQFEGGKSEDYPLTIGSGSFIPGFEEQLIGAEIGKELEVNVKFPEDYHAEDLKGKDATFKCTVNSIHAQELPELNDEFASDHSDFEMIDEFKKDLREKLSKEKEEAVRRMKEDEAVAAAVANAEMDIPDAMVDTEVDRMMNEMAQQMASQGISIEQYMQFTGATEESLRETMRPDAVKRISNRLVLEAICDAEKIEPTDERLDEEITKMAEMYQMEADKMKSLIDEKQRELMKLDLAVQDAITLIADAAVEVEKADEEEAAEEEKTEE